MEAPPYSAAAVDVVRLPGGASERDHVAVEEPLEIRIGGSARRGDDADARATTRSSRSASASPRACGRRPRALPADLAANTVDVDAPGFDPARLQRSFYTSSSCGVCGKGALEAVAVEAPRVESQLRVPLALVVVAARPAARGAGGVRRDRRPARDRAVHGGRRAALRARGRRPPQRAGQGDRLGVRRRAAAARRRRALRQRPALVRARAEGGGRRLPDPRRRRRAVEPRRLARRRPRHHALRLRPRRHAPTSTPSRGGSSTDGRPARRRREHALRLAEGARAQSTARRSRNAPGACSARRATSGSPSASAADGLELPFELLDDGTDVRAPIAGVVAGLRAARTTSRS